MKQAPAERIDRGELERCGALPTEQEFCEQFGVSRSAVRRALRELRVLCGHVLGMSDSRVVEVI